MKKLLTLLLFLAPAIMARAEEVTLCLRDLSGGVMSEFPFRVNGYGSFTTDAEGCATVDLSPGENQIQYDHGFTNFEWDGTQTNVDVNITEGYWMTVRLTGADESDADALRGATFRVFDAAHSNPCSIGEDLTVHFWLTPAYVQGGTWSYQLDSPKYPTPRTSVDLTATGNHPTVDLREGRTPVDIARPLGVGGTPLTAGSIGISQDDSRGYPLMVSISLDEIPGGGAYRSWMLPGTYDFSLHPEGNYLGRLEKFTIGAEPATVAFDLSRSVRLDVHLIGYDGKPIAGRDVNIYSTDRSESEFVEISGGATTNAEGVATVYATPGRYSASVNFYNNPLFPYPTDPCGETDFDVPAGETAEATISFEGYTAFLITVKGLDESISPSCEFQYKEAGSEYWSSISLREDYDFEGEGRRYGTLTRTDGPLSGRLHVDVASWGLPAGSPLYVDHYQPVATTEGGVVTEIDLAAMQEVTLRAPEGYRFYSGLFIDGEEYTFGYSDTGEPITAIAARIMPGEHTWQATLTSTDGATRYPTGTVQTFTVADAPLDVTYAFDAADYPGLSITVKDVDGTPAAGFYVGLENVGTGDWGELSTDAEGRGTYFVDSPGTYRVEVCDADGNYLQQTLTVELGQGMTERTVSFEGWHSFTLQMPDLWQYAPEASTATVTWTSATDPEDPRNGTEMHNEWRSGEQPGEWTQWLPAGNLAVRYTARDNNGPIVDATSQTAMPAENTTYAVNLANHHRVSYVAGDGTTAHSSYVTLYHIGNDGRRTPATGYLLPDGTYLAYYAPFDTYSDSRFRENCDSVVFDMAGVDREVRFNVSRDDYVLTGLTHYDERIAAADLGIPSDPRWASVYINEYASFYLLPGRDYSYYIRDLIVYADNGDALWYYTLPEPRPLRVDGKDPYVAIPLDDYRLVDLRGTLDGTPVDGYYLIQATGGLTAGSSAYGTADAHFALRPGSYTVIVERSSDGTLLYGRTDVTEETADGRMTVELSTEPTGIRDAATAGAMPEARPTDGGIAISGAAGTPIGVDVYTADGRTALRTTAADGETIGTKSLPAGVYVVRLTQGNTAKTQRVLVR